jgi:hypothetical protein
MAFIHRTLTEEDVVPDVWKVARPDAPAPLRSMVAKGLAPLPPASLLMALYCFWASGDPEHGEQAARTVETLPPTVIGGALDDKKLYPGIIDFLARKHARSVDVLARIIRHPNVDDETLGSVARLCPEAICDELADNQQRWMKFPAIVESLYQNPNCRMSVAQRMLELAVRQGIDVKLPNMEEIRAALKVESAPIDDSRDEVFKGAAGRALETHADVVERLQRAAADEEFDATAAAPEDEPSELEGLDALLERGGGDDMSLPMEEEGGAAPEVAVPAAEPAKDRVTLISQLRPMEKIRIALLGTAFERAVLIRDSNKSVCLSAIKSPRVKENEVVAFSNNRTLPHEVVRYIAGRREWTKLYAVKLNLVLNPKTPLSQAMGFLGHLHAHDVNKVARSKNIPQALATAAKRRGAVRR